MPNKPLPIQEPATPKADPYTPEIRKRIEANSIKRSVIHLSHGMSLLENGLHSYFTHLTSNAANASETSRAQPLKIQAAIVETRSLTLKILETVGKGQLLQNPNPLETPAQSKPKSPEETTRALQSGLSGCRNAIRSLLEHDESALMKNFSDSNLGKRTLGRLASLSSALEKISVPSTEDIKTVFQPKSEKSIRPAPKPVIKKPRRKKMVPVDSIKAKALLDLFENSQHHFRTESVFEIAKEIAIQLEDEGVGHTFEELRALFDCSNQQIKKRLLCLKRDLKAFNITLTGSLDQHGRQAIAFETEDQQDPSTQSIK